MRSVDALLQIGHKRPWELLCTCLGAEMVVAAGQQRPTGDSDSQLIDSVTYWRL